MPPVYSLTVKPGGDDAAGRLERPASLRLPGVELGPLETSMPQGEDLPSPTGSQNAASMVLKIVFLLHCVIKIVLLSYCIALYSSSRMSLTTSCLTGVVLLHHLIAPPQSESPNALLFLLTSKTLRTTCLNRALQRAQRKVRWSNRDAKDYLFSLYIFLQLKYFLPPLHPLGFCSGGASEPE